MQELEIARLHTALQALTAAPNVNPQPLYSAKPGLHQSDTGVFSSQCTPNQSTAQRSAAAAAVSSAATNPAASMHTDGSRRPHTAQHSQQHLFLYPEDTPLPPRQETGSQHCARLGSWDPDTVKQPHCMALPIGAGGRAQPPQAYTVQEPDSPAQPFAVDLHSTDRSSQNGPQPRATHTVSRPSNAPKHPTAGCLYQDTTITRVTTPSRSGRAWSHHEEITVRQIREIRQSEAQTAHLPAPHCPQHLQGICSAWCTRLLWALHDFKNKSAAEVDVCFEYIGCTNKLFILKRLEGFFMLLPGSSLDNG